MDTSGEKFERFSSLFNQAIIHQEGKSMSAVKSKKVRNVALIIIAAIAIVFVVGFIAWRCSPLSVVSPVKMAFGGEINEVSSESYYEPDGSYRHVTADDPIAFYMRHPIFEGDTNMFYSCDDTLTRFLNAASGANLQQFCELNGIVGSIIGSHASSFVAGEYAGEPVEDLQSEALIHNEDPSQESSVTGDGEEVPNYEVQDGIEGFNYLIDQANAGRITYIGDVYSDEAVAQDPDKAVVHAVLYHGDPDKPLAIVVPGGGFVAVGSYADAYTYAQKLHERGYNVATLVYRVGNQLHTDDQWQRGLESVSDLAALVSYIQDHGEALNVSLDDYAVIGSSAGGLMATAFSFDSLDRSAATFDLPRPALCICNYGLYWDLVPTEADRGLAVFAVAGAGDPFGFGGVIDQVPMIEDCLGSENVSIRVAEHYNHGSNLGKGTIFDGWIDEAMDFWEAHR